MNVPIDVSGVTLRTERLLLRPFWQSDLEDFYAYASVDGVGQMAGWQPHESREKTQTILNSFIEEKKTFALEYEGRVIGSLGIEKYNENRFPEFADMKARELGFVLSKEYWGMGLMPEAVNEAIRWLFEDIGLDLIVCGHFKRNTRSARVQEKCGFVPYAEGTFTTRMGTEEADIVNLLTRERRLEKQRKEYYKAYDERYRTIHELGSSWSSGVSTPIVMDVLGRYHIAKSDKLLEAGCGEGRDAKAVLDAGYDLEAVDVSPEAVAWCREQMPEYAERFSVRDCLIEDDRGLYDFIYSVAVIHMLVRDEDRTGFYSFIRRHLNEGGIALICSMGDGETEFATDAAKAFDAVKREHPLGEVTVAATSCRMVSFETFEREIQASGLSVIEKGLTEALPEFNSLMYAVVRRA